MVTKVVVWFSVVAALLLAALARGHGAEIPRGWTCEHVRQIAVSVGGSLTWDRERTIAIAAAYGVTLTEPQLAALRQCFQDSRR